MSKTMQKGLDENPKQCSSGNAEDVEKVLVESKTVTVDDDTKNKVDDSRPLENEKEFVTREEDHFSVMINSSY